MPNCAKSHQNENPSELHKSTQQKTFYDHDDTAHKILRPSCK